MSNHQTDFFTTADDIKVPAVTTIQMREVDRIAIEETGPNLFQMMENAGRNLALTAMEMLGRQWQKAAIVVMSGPGGNGGGGICAARHLANRHASVRLCLSEPAKLAAVPAFQRHIFQQTAGNEVSLSDLRLQPVDLIVDALIGYSLRGAPRGTSRDLIRWANESGAPILSLDIPSGVDATTGASAGEFITPAQTMTLALPKTGLLPEKSASLLLADIGIPESVYRKLGLPYESPFGDQFRVKIKCTSEK